MRPIQIVVGVLILIAGATHGAAGPQFEDPVTVFAAGEELIVPGLSVPEYADWNADGTRDLIVGEGGDGHPGMVRIYLNQGTNALPVFEAHFHAQTDEGDLAYPGG